MIAETDYLSFNVDAADEAIFQWKEHKREGIMAYRDHGYVSAITGAMAPVHHTSWTEAMDDSLDAFLGKKCM